MFAAFVGAHRIGVERFASRKLGSDPAAVEDVCADVFVVALRRFDEISGLPDHRARLWLLRVTELRCLNHYRARSRRDRAYMRVATDPLTGPDSFNELGFEFLESTSPIAERVQRALAMLSPAYQEVLRLDMFEDMTGPQIAKLLHTTPLAVRLRLMRAKRAFRQTFVEMFGPPQWEGGDDS